MKIERRDEVAILRMEAGRGNAMGPGWIREMEARLEEVEASDARALVITGQGRIFSAGLDLPALQGLSPEAIHDFLEAFTELVLAVFEFPRPVIAAVNGHAIAGGCILAQQADVRLMVREGARCGLKEIDLGVGLPIAAVETLRYRLAPRELEHMAFSGALIEPAEALERGLCDELVDAELLEGRAIEVARAWAEKPARAFAHIKMRLRRPSVERVRFDLASDTHAWISTWTSAEAQARVAAAVAELSKKGR